MPLSRRPIFTPLLISLVALASGCKEPGRSAVSAGERFDHVVLVVLESANFDEADKDPYLHSLEARGSLLSNDHAVTHPGYPNDLALVGGKLFPTILDSQIDIDDSRSVADLLEARGLTWKSYAEDYPGHCFLGDTSGEYARKSVPLLSFTTIQKDLLRCARVVNASQFAVDWNSRALPNYAYYSPDLAGDGVSSTTDLASRWLKSFLEPLLADTEGMKGTLIAITFDEASDYVGDNQIYTLFLGPMIQAGAVDSGKYDHFSLLKTIETNFGLGSLSTGDNEAQEILGVWKAATE